MLQPRLTWWNLPWLWLATAAAHAQVGSRIEESFFAERLYPAMQNVQCNLCHNDNGVASDTELQFPGTHATLEQITAFGLKLIDLIDRDDPKQSLLYLKPTNIEEHTGGERVKPGSEEERALLAWIHYLAGFTDEQVIAAKKRIALVEQRALEPLMVRRLTHRQYNNTVRDLLGDESQPANSFPKEDFIRGFKNQTESQGISPLQAEAYARSAERLAENAFRGGDSRGLVPCDRETSNGSHCVTEFVRQFGLKAFRRPLNEQEVAAYTKLYESAPESTGAFRGAKIVVEAMLQSPHFLFRVQQGSKANLEQYEVASRLSYFLWDTMPTDEMLAAAESGEFSSREQVEAAARRMLQDPRSKPALDEFLSQWLRFDRVLTATRDRRRFRSFNTELAAAMVEETRSLFRHLVWEDRDFMEFFTADYTFPSSDLAQLYGLPRPSEEYAMVKYPLDSGRSGVLGHGSFLVATSKPAETSPTERGLFVRNQFLGHEVPPPPPGVNTSLPEITEDEPTTNRERLHIHLNSEACSSCHRLIDPIGLGLEQYDAIGAFHEKLSFSLKNDESNDGDARKVELEIDTTAFIQGIEDSAFSTPKELGKILANSDVCQKCIVKQLFRYAFGREETAGDQPIIDVMLNRFRDSGFRFRELMVATVTSDLFLQGVQVTEE